MRHTRSRLEIRDRGAAAVEFALISLPLIALVLGVVQFGFAYNTQESLTQSARAAARQAAICGSSCTSTSSIATAAHNTSPNLTTASISVSVQYCPTGGTCSSSPSYCPTGATQATGNELVTLRYPYTFFKAVTGSALSITISGKASMPCSG